MSQFYFLSSLFTSSFFYSLERMLLVSCTGSFVDGTWEYRSCYDDDDFDEGNFFAL